MSKYLPDWFKVGERRVIIHKVLVEISDLDNLCEVCKKKDKSVTQYLILTGYKICKSCLISKTIFPI